MGQKRTGTQHRYSNAHKGKEPTMYTMGVRIIQVYPGEDGTIRTAVIKTASGDIKRAAKALCSLSVDR